MQPTTPSLAPSLLHLRAPLCLQSPTSALAATLGARLLPTGPVLCRNNNNLAEVLLANNNFSGDLYNFGTPLLSSTKLSGLGSGAQSVGPSWDTQPGDEQGC